MADWNPLYGVWQYHVQKSPDPKCVAGQSPDEYRALMGQPAAKPEFEIPVVKAASEWGGEPLPRCAPIPLADFKTIVGVAARPMDAKVDPTNKDSALVYPEAEGKMKNYLFLLSEAFRIFGIDTVQAQALFIAHAAGESSAFAKFTEGAVDTSLYVDEPENVVVGSGDAGGPIRYLDAYYVTHGQTNDIDPKGVMVAGSTMVVAPGATKATLQPVMDPRKWDETFIGRGPIQVTFRYGYIQTLVFMQVVAEKAAAGDAALITAAIDAIKENPREAARAKHTFLFGAGYMHMSRMVKNSPYGFTEVGMSGGNVDNRGALKSAVYLNAYNYLHDSVQEYKSATRDA